MILRNLPGEQATAVAAGLCGPTMALRGIRHGTLPEHLAIPVGPSGVLLGKVGAGDRMLLPLGDPGEFSRIHLAADDAIDALILSDAESPGRVRSSDIVGRFSGEEFVALLPETTKAGARANEQPAPNRKPHQRRRL